MTSDRARGILLGLACGDALGRPVEFASSAEIATEYGQLTEMVGEGTWNQPAGTVTDDTEQMLCIARSIFEQQKFDPADIADRFVSWYNSNPFDIGRMTMKALSRLDTGETWDEAGQAVWERSREGQNAGNGSIMRCPPVAIRYTQNLDRLVDASKQSSQITHADPRCTYGCAILNLTLAGLLTDGDSSLQDALDYVATSAPDELISSLRPVARGTLPEPLETSGYVIDSLQTALHDGLTAGSVEEAIVTAVNRGGDTDTIGAVAGAIAGARFGDSDIPHRWRDAIEYTNEIASLAEQLQQMKDSDH